MAEIPQSLLELYAEKPVAMVEELFKVKPDPAQIKVLEAFPHTPRIAMQSCTGAGKTSTISWLAWNFLLTRPHPVIGAASVSKPTLKATLWPELARWYTQSDILQALFEVQEEQIVFKAHPKTWHLKARSWAADANAEQIGNALRGFHSDFVMWLLDESGSYPNAVLPICEAIFSGNPTEAHIVQAGNPTHLSGPLWFAAKHQDYWFVIEITADPDSPMRTPRVSKEHARQQINAWGIDSPWVQVNIFGRFPSASLNALIGPEEVEASMKRYWREHDIGEAPRILGVDVAREGDDKSVIAMRRGISASFPLKQYRSLNSLEGAAQVNMAWSEFDADACFVDNTGGFGAGWLDQLRVLGRSPIGIHFSARATQEDRYHNKRAEMYFRLVEWIRAGGSLPESRELVAQLTATTYTFQKDSSKLIIAPKEEIKLKINASPDEADAIALTFAETITAKQRRGRAPLPPDEVWNPYSEAAIQPGFGGFSR